VRKHFVLWSDYSLGKTTKPGGYMQPRAEGTPMWCQEKENQMSQFLVNKHFIPVHKWRQYN
jgi:hypothetical protein